MFTPLSKISSVEIKGNNNVSKSDISKAINVKDDSRMYTYSTSKAEKKLKENTLVKDVKVTKHFPNKMTVKVTEDQIVALIKRKINMFQ